MALGASSQWHQMRPPSFPFWQGGMNAVPRYTISESAPECESPRGLKPAARVHSNGQLLTTMIITGVLIGLPTGKQVCPCHTKRDASGQGVWMART